MVKKEILGDISPQSQNLKRSHWRWPNKENWERGRLSSVTQASALTKTKVPEPQEPGEPNSRQEEANQAYHQSTRVCAWNCPYQRGLEDGHQDQERGESLLLPATYNFCIRTPVSALPEPLALYFPDQGATFLEQLITASILRLLRF